MRTPTAFADAYAWWTAALAGEKQQITTEPRPGYYRRRLVKGGPWVGVRIYLDQIVGDDGELLSDEVMKAECDGAPCDPEDAWIASCDHPITREDYRYYVSAAAWDKTFDPVAPAANPKKAVDWHTVKPPTFPATPKRKSRA
jgi:hypothetical protein